VIHSERILITTESFPSLKPEMLNVQLDERIRPLAPWPEDIPVHYCVHLIERSGRFNSYIVISLPERDIQKTVKPIAETGFRIQQCVPHVAAIAAFTGRLTDDPVLACIFDGSYLEILFAEKGLPYYSQISPLDDEILDFDLMGQAIFNVRQIIDSRFNKSVKKTLFFSKKEMALPDSIGEEEIWRPDLASLLETDHPDIAWKFPELLGAPYVSKDFDCLPSDFKTSYLIQDINRVAASLAFGGLVILGATGVYLSGQKAKVMADYQQLNSMVNSRKEKVLAQLPDEQDVRNIAEVIRVIKAVSKEPPLDSLLYSIALSVPERVVIDELKINRAETEQAEVGPGLPPPDAFTGGAQAVQHSEKNADVFFDKPLVMTLKLVTKGEFQQVKTRLEKAVDLLAMRFNVGHIKMEYREEISQGELACQLEVYGDKG